MIDSPSSVFESLNIAFPIILNRNSALLLGKSLIDKLNKLDVSIEEILMPKEILKEKLVKKYSKLKLDFTNLKQNLTDQFLELKKVASQTCCFSDLHFQMTQFLPSSPSPSSSSL